MAAKKKTTELTDAPNELAAPAVLRRLQMDAAKFSAQIDDLESVVETLKQISPNAKNAKEDVARAESALVTARDNFGKTAKILLSYDRGIDTNRKEGEKISVAECKEFFAQLILSIDLALERTIIADAQSAALCDSPEDFHVAHAENYRTAKQSALESAIAESVLPKWIL